MGYSLLSIKVEYTPYIIGVPTPRANILLDKQVDVLDFERSEVIQFFDPNSIITESDIETTKYWFVQHFVHDQLMKNRIATPK